MLQENNTKKMQESDFIPQYEQTIRIEKLRRMSDYSKSIYMDGYRKGWAEGVGNALAEGIAQEMLEAIEVLLEEDMEKNRKEDMAKRLVKNMAEYEDDRELFIKACQMIKSGGMDKKIFDYGVSEDTLELLKVVIKGLLPGLINYKKSSRPLA